MFSVSVAPAKGIPSELEKMRIPQFEQLAVARWLRAPQTRHVFSVRDTGCFKPLLHVVVVSWKNSSTYGLLRYQS